MSDSTIPIDQDVSKTNPEQNPLDRGALEAIYQDTAPDLTPLELFDLLAAALCVRVVSKVVEGVEHCRISFKRIILKQEIESQQLYITESGDDWILHVNSHSAVYAQLKLFGKWLTLSVRSNTPDGRFVVTSVTFEIVYKAVAGE